LQTLGLYVRNPSNILITLKELHDAQLFLPIVFTLQNDGYYSNLYHIGIFPLFYSVDRRGTIPQALAQSLCKDPSDHIRFKAEGVGQLSIYLIDSSDIPSISALAKEMALSFSKIYLLNLFFKHRCRIVSFLLTVMTITAPDLNTVYYFSHHMRLKRGSLSSPV
jgi:hypothetical protein